MNLGVVADDITGAGDIGSMTAGAGYLSHIHALENAGRMKGAAADVVILDTDSRLDGAGAAYRKVREATQLLAAAGCRRFYNKTCSVFRGNIGAEFDAMLDALGEEFAVVVLGFPQNGRLTRDGVHYVHGEKLEDSQFRHDPVHPMTNSDLVGILQSQTKRRVAGIGYRDIAEGPEALRSRLRSMRAEANYVILDVVDDGALETIASAVSDQAVLCGSSALAAFLPASWRPPRSVTPASLPPKDGLGVLHVAGSLTPQTAQQIAYLEKRGVPVLTLDTGSLFAQEDLDRDIARLADAAAATLLSSGDVLVCSDREPSLVRETLARGAARGLSARDAARRVSAALADVAACCRAHTQCARFVVAGGDTSARVCRRLGIGSMRVWREVAPGLPSSVSLPRSEEEAPALLVLKSGSFGGPDFLERASCHLKEAPLAA